MPALGVGAECDRQGPPIGGGLKFFIYYQITRRKKNRNTSKKITFCLKSQPSYLLFFMWEMIARLLYVGNCTHLFPMQLHRSFYFFYNVLLFFFCLHRYHRLFSSLKLSSSPKLSSTYIRSEKKLDLILFSDYSHRLIVWGFFNIIQGVEFFPFSLYIFYIELDVSNFNYIIADHRRSGLQDWGLFLYKHKPYQVLLLFVCWLNLVFFNLWSRVVLWLIVVFVCFVGSCVWCVSLSRNCTKEWLGNMNLEVKKEIEWEK